MAKPEISKDKVIFQLLLEPNMGIGAPKVQEVKGVQGFTLSCTCSHNALHYVLRNFLLDDTFIIGTFDHRDNNHKAKNKILNVIKKTSKKVLDRAKNLQLKFLN